jgi:guanine deaminase
VYRIARRNCPESLRVGVLPPGPYSFRMSNTDEHYMRLALDAARRGIERGQSPFGACLVRGGEVLACEHNTVGLDHDPTAHAEVRTIREACRHVGSHRLDGATIYATTEPCPMCFAAIHWARLERVVFAARVEDARRFGFHDLQIPTAKLRGIGVEGVAVEAEVLRPESLELYRQWQSRRGDESADAATSSVHRAKQRHRRA